MFLVTIALALATVLAPHANDPDEMVYIESGNQQMAAAIATARAKLPYFLARFANPQRGDAGFGIKFDLVAGEGVEFIWADVIAQEGETLRVKLANEPLAPGFKLGQPMTVRLSEVIDWSYARDRKLHGHYTTRVLLDRMTPSQAAEMRAILADPE